MSTGGKVDTVPKPGGSTRGASTPAAAWIELRAPHEICSAYGSRFMPPAPLDKVAVALGTVGQQPLNARRVSPERGACGWYIWGGEGGGRSGHPGFFQTIPVAHLLERCPQMMPFLALAPGWRVRLAADGLEIKPPHAVAPPANIAVRRIGSRTSWSPPVKQWVWLSILLHILAVVLFGDTTGAGSRRGDRLGGPLNVTLQGPVDRVADARVALRTDTRLRSVERRESAPPVLSPVRPAKDAAANRLVSTSPPKAADDVPATPIMPPVIATEVEKPVTTFVVPVATPEPLVAPKLPEPPAVRLPEPLPTLDAMVPPKTIEPPKTERDIALPSEPIPRLVPLAPVRTEREITAPAEAAPRLKTFVPPRVEPETVVPPVEIPRMAPLAPLTPPPIEREIVRPAELLPRLPPVTPAAAIETVSPTDAVPRAAPAVADRAAEPVRTAPTTTPSTASNVSPTPALPSVSRVPPAAPGSAVGDTLAPHATIAAPPPATAASDIAPRIDLDAVRRRAREIVREGSGPRTLLPFNVRPREEVKTKEQQAFDKALKRPDCKEAYSGMGLAAVIPLLRDAISENGCKW